MRSKSDLNKESITDEEFSKNVRGVSIILSNACERGLAKAVNNEKEVQREIYMYVYIYVHAVLVGYDALIKIYGSIKDANKAHEICRGRPRTVDRKRRANFSTKLHGRVACMHACMPEAWIEASLTI